MAEGFEPYHVPQQSRRDKLRVLLDDNNNTNCQIPLFDPSIVLPSDLSIFQEINGNPFLYTPQIPRFLDHSSSVTIAHNNNNSCSSNSNTNGQGNLSLSLSSLHHTNTSTSNNNNNNDFSSKSITTTSSVPLGPFTGYSLILKRSRFLKPAQILLDELCDVSKGIYVDDDSSNLMMDPPQPYSNVGDEQFGKKKSRLISMLHEVYHKYKQYHEQLQMVVTSFESVAGLGNAAPFANIAINTMSKHFKCLKDAIIDQLQFTTNKSSHQINCERGVGISGKGIYCQRQETQPAWRPQRGLPERAVTVLRAWLFEHFLHPYPTDTDKVMLAKQTGLSRNQVSNWFINARVRLWKPMVEEIHMLETREGHNKSLQKDGPNNSSNNNNDNSNNPIEHFSMSNSHACESSTPSTSTPRFQDLPSKRTRNDLANIPNNIGRFAESINLSYGNFSTGVGGGGGVSLTLGLHQNSGNIGLSEAFPINAARRFGIENNTNSGRFMVGGFDEQNGQFGRNNTMVGGQFLHDFAG